MAELLTTRDVADLCRVTQQTVYRWVRDGELPVIVLPGGQHRFRRSDVDALLVARPPRP